MGGSGITLAQDVQPLVVTEHIRVVFDGGYGLQIQGRPDVGELFIVCHALRETRLGLKWALADLLVYADAQFGDIASQLEHVTGYGLNTLANMKAVATYYPRRYRDLFDLDWGHYDSARQAALGPQRSYDELLIPAQDERWTVVEVRARKAQLLATITPGLAVNDVVVMSDAPPVDRLYTSLRTGDVQAVRDIVRLLIEAGDVDRTVMASIGQAILEAARAD